MTKSQELNTELYLSIDDATHAVSNKKNGQIGEQSTPV
jgi:hypothetical protein